MNEDKIIKKLIDHDDEFQKVREEIRESRNDVLTGQDTIIGMLQKFDTEQAAMRSALKRHEDDIYKLKMSFLST